MAEKPIVEFIGRGKSLTTALENVANKITNAIACGTFSRAQLERMRMAIQLRIGRENDERNHPNTGQKVPPAKL